MRFLLPPGDCQPTGHAGEGGPFLLAPHKRYRDCEAQSLSNVTSAFPRAVRVLPLNRNPHVRQETEALVRLRPLDKRDAKDLLQLACGVGAGLGLADGCIKK